VVDSADDDDQALYVVDEVDPFPLTQPQPSPPEKCTSTPMKLRGDTSLPLKNEQTGSVRRAVTPKASPKKSPWRGKPARGKKEVPPLRGLLFGRPRRGGTAEQPLQPQKVSRTQPPPPPPPDEYSSSEGWFLALTVLVLWVDIE